MKLSEAIRAGASVTQPLIERYFIERAQTHEITHACALIAAYVGVEGVIRKFTSIEDWLTQAWPELNRDYQHPIKKDMPAQDLFGIVLNLSDTQGWTREQVADWLEEQGL
jgi:hypothetical protein